MGASAGKAPPQLFLFIIIIVIIIKGECDDTVKYVPKENKSLTFKQKAESFHLLSSN